MLIQWSKVKRRIHDQRRKNVEDRIKIRQMARVFERPEERHNRESLEQLRWQDWK